MHPNLQLVEIALYLIGLLREVLDEEEEIISSASFDDTDLQQRQNQIPVPFLVVIHLQHIGLSNAHIDFLGDQLEETI